MTVMVDELKAHPQRASTAQGRRHFGEGKSSCHLTCDGDLAELHAFAKKIGLRREWFQDRLSGAHYDLTARRRAAAVAAGAVEVSGRKQAQDRLASKLVPRRVGESRASEQAPEPDPSLGPLFAPRGARP